MPRASKSENLAVWFGEAAPAAWSTDGSDCSVASAREEYSLAARLAKEALMRCAVKEVVDCEMDEQASRDGSLTEREAAPLAKPAQRRTLCRNILTVTQDQ